MQDKASHLDNIVLDKKVEDAASKGRTLIPNLGDSQTVRIGRKEQSSLLFTISPLKVTSPAVTYSFWCH